MSHFAEPRRAAIPRGVRTPSTIAGQFVGGATVAALSARKAMFAGLVATPVGMGLLVLGQRSGSMPVFLLGAAVCGVAAALGYRGGLAVANGLAPEERRAEVASVYFICCFCGNALPVIGAGALGQAADPRLADLVFAAVISAVAIMALAVGLATRRAAGAASDPVPGR